MLNKENFPEFNPDQVKREEQQGNDTTHIQEQEKHENTQHNEQEQQGNDSSSTKQFEQDHNNQQEASEPEKEWNTPETDIANKQGRNFNR